MQGSLHGWLGIGWRWLCELSPTKECGGVGRSSSTRCSRSGSSTRSCTLPASGARVFNLAIVRVQAGSVDIRPRVRVRVLNVSLSIGLQRPSKPFAYA
jgi:hypothetical protein